jgi:hypothetical protein
MPERVAEMIILLLELALGIYLIVQRIRFVRWRREYELRGCLKSHDLVNRLSVRRIAIRSISVSEVCARCS